MYRSTLRAVGGSVMIAIPKPIQQALGLSVNCQVGVSVSEGRLIVEPCTRPHYTLDELMAQCDPSVPMTDEEREWIEAEPVGREIP
jgi:antitoxin ChpS